MDGVSSGLGVEARRPRRTVAGASYVVSCSSDFRNKIERLAEKRRASVADLARAVLLLMPKEVIDHSDDPGEPAEEDRELIQLRSGASEGRVLRRKPRLQMRLPAGYDPVMLRKALGLALSMARGETELSLSTEADKRAEEAVEKVREELAEENAALRQTFETIAAPVIANGIRTRSDALFVLGFAPSEHPDRSQIRRRWRKLASVHHPDSPFGDHDRMSQLNQALSLLS